MPTTPATPATPAAMTLVIGKGGVGKTTIARGLAARAGRGGAGVPIVLGLDGDPRAGAAGSFGFDTEAVDGGAALRSVAAELLGSKRLAGALLSHFAIQRLAAIVPGLREVASLVVALRHVEAGRRVVVDMPATGHGIAWLDTVRLLRGLEPTGRARALVEELHAHLADRARTRLVVVTLGERLVMNETRELCRALPRPPDLLIVNGVRRVPRIDAGVLDRVARVPGRAAAIASLRSWLDPSAALVELPALDVAATCELPLYPRAPTPWEIAASLDGEVSW